jgi:hypothetical protein
MAVQYTTGSGGARKLIPAPMASISKEFTKNGAGDIIGSVYNITLTGIMLSFRGSPSCDPSSLAISWNPSPDDSLEVPEPNRLACILRKQEAIRELFAYTGDDTTDGGRTSGDGGLLEIQSSDGSSPLKFAAKVVDINFEGEGPNTVGWNQICRYTITLEAESMIGPDGADPVIEDKFAWNISDSTESWDIAEDDGLRGIVGSGDGLITPTKSFTVTHTVSAVGRNKYDTASPTQLATSGIAWQQARGYVEQILKYEACPVADLTRHQLNASGVLDLEPGYVSRDHARTQQVDETTGSFAVTETFILTTAEKALEQIECSITTSSTEALTRVSLNGTITGLNSNCPTASGISAYTNASGVWTGISSDSSLRSRAAILGGLADANTLNVIPINKTVGTNPNQGIITYSVEFDDRPSGCIPGAISENINIQDTTPGYLFASIPTIGRKRGPILQWLGAADSPYVRSLSLEVVVRPSSYPDCDVDTIKKAIITDKPSNREQPDDMKTAIDHIIDAADPTDETGVENNKVFYAAPQESWDYKTGRYSLNITWTYEKSLTNYPTIFSPNMNF